ncbi:TetR/AcrR family transcriptional regulator C-terminal domain-containing protein [Planomonospora venezuelensis]|uniref:AcrR family transcriptional regulator n=1 Tax=Planomonospora venezuelensis TaxID=1999 RepID=A0A841D9M3_PLAVE|nr:TetR/AcrR family transcriptional regulator C-terminal domain-containing protein [Planomonospora venezuelensis]MBB5967322.1 AcrR family transcriptional regulator [Planomonospora venezuelensis]GIN04712.1 TetR family transcriptional regulator [Planomonospora venezuelensis]
MVVYAGQGDPEKTLALLWRVPVDEGARTAPGPKPGLTVDAIVDAAIAVADAGTMDGLSMRAVGERLGRTAMSLYTYVPSKRELVDLMYDQAHAETPAEHDLSGGWRAAAESWAHGLRALYLRHPWLLQVSHARPVLGPHEQGVLEAVLRILDAAGLEPVAVRPAVGSLFSLVRGSAQAAAEARSAAGTTGTPDREWWTLRAGLLHRLVPDFADRFPLSARLSAQAPPSAGPEPRWEREAREAFTGGLAILLDGIESRTRPPGGSGTVIL